MRLIHGKELQAILVKTSHVTFLNKPFINQDKIKHEMIGKQSMLFFIVVYCYLRCVDLGSQSYQN